MLDHVVTILESAGIDRIVVTVGFGREAVVEELRQRHPEASIAVQDDQLGTGHAVDQTGPLLKVAGFVLNPPRMVP